MESCRLKKSGNYCLLRYPQLKKKLEDIHLLSKQAEKNNKDAKELVDEAGENHANATNNYEMLGKG